MTCNYGSKKSQILKKKKKNLVEVVFNVNTCSDGLQLCTHSGRQTIKRIIVRASSSLVELVFLFVFCFFLGLFLHRDSWMV